MLTRDDYSQFKKLIDESLESKLEKKFDEKLKPIHKKLNKLQKDFDVLAKSNDRELMDHRHRLEIIESKPFFAKL